MLRGLGVDVWSADNVRVSLAARLDKGRSESSSPALAGMGDVEGTLRARLSAQWKLEEGWQWGATASIDDSAAARAPFRRVLFLRASTPC